MPPMRDTVPVKYSSTNSWSRPIASNTCAPRYGRDRRDAHLRHHLEHALARGLDVVLHRAVRVHVAEAVELLRDEVLDRFEREVGVDRARAVSHQQRHVVHFARVPALDHEPHHRARLLADEVVVDRRGEEERRDRRPLLVRVAVGQHEDALALRDRQRCFLTRTIERFAERRATARDRGTGRRSHGP